MGGKSYSVGESPIKDTIEVRQVMNTSGKQLRVSAPAGAPPLGEPSVQPLANQAGQPLREAAVQPAPQPASMTSVARKLTR